MATSANAAMDQARSNAALVAAFKARDEEAVLCAIEGGADVIEADWDGWTPLHHATSRGMVRAINELVARGAAIEAKDKNGDTPLHFAATSNESCLPTLPALLAHGANVHVVDRSGRTPLHLAAHLGTPEAMAELVERGASIDARDNDGHTPLWMAACTCKLPSMRWLLEHGADLAADLEGFKRLAADARVRGGTEVRSLITPSVSPPHLLPPPPPSHRPQKMSLIRSPVSHYLLVPLA